MRETVKRLQRREKKMKKRIKQLQNIHEKILSLRYMIMRWHDVCFKRNRYIQIEKEVA